MTPGALNSSGRSPAAAIGPWPSSGLPSGSTTRPRMPFADRDAHHLAGAAHRLALLDLLPLAEERDADVVLLEVERDADDAVLELEPLERDAVLEPVDARDAVADLQDGADLGRSVSTSYCSIRCLRIEVISSGRSFTSALLRSVSSFVGSNELAAERSAGGRARWRRRAASRPAGPARRSGRGRRCASPRPCGRTPARSCATIAAASSSDSSWAVVSSTARRPRARSTSASNSSAIAGISPARPFSATSAEEVAHELVGAAGHLVEHARLRRRVELRVREERLELGRLDERRGELAELARERPSTRPCSLRGLEQRARVHALRDGHRPSSCPAPARRSRARRSPRRPGGAGRRCRAPCRRRAAVASTVRSATSVRIWSIARAVSASICFRVSSSRRCRSASASSLARAICASATFRASARMLGRLRAGLREDRPVLLEQLAGLVAGVVCLLDRLADPVAALVDRLLDRAERVLPQDEERDPERDERPDHQAGDDLDQIVATTRLRGRSSTSTQTRT